MLFSYFLFNFIVLYIILKLRPPQTQNFLKCWNILSGSRDINPFTTAGRKTDTIFEFFWVFLHTCHTVNNHLIALRFSEGFVHGLIFLGEKTELIYLYCSLFYTFSKKLVKFFEKKAKKVCALLKICFFLF